MNKVGNSCINYAHDVTQDWCYIVRTRRGGPCYWARPEQLIPVVQAYVNLWTKQQYQ